MTCCPRTAQFETFTFPKSRSAVFPVDTLAPPSRHWNGTRFCVPHRLALGAGQELRAGQEVGAHDDEIPKEQSE